MLIRPVRSCPTAIASLNCTDAYCCASLIAATFNTLKSPSDGTATAFSPFTSMFTGLPFHCKFILLTELLRSILSRIKWCIFVASLCCQFIFNALLFCVAVNNFSTSLPFSISAVSMVPFKLILSFIPLLRKPSSVTLNEGFMVCILKPKLAYLSGTLVTLPNLNFTVYN